MNYKTDIPQIVALRERVEREVGFKPKVHSDFLRLTSEIETRLNEHVSESTLERVWGYSTRGYDTVSDRTLTVLSQLIGSADWSEFVDHLHREAHAESELFTGDVLMVGNLPVGTRLQIGWQPDRLCVVRYLGENRFVAEETENSTIQPGDRFSCLQMQKGRELYMDLFQRASENGTPDENARYVVGQRSGLTTLRVLPKEEK